MKEEIYSYDYGKHPPGIIITKTTLDILLEQQYAGQLISLYLFYAYTAHWQETNTIKSTTGYTAKGLGWGEEKVKKYKKQLIKLDLIRDKTTRDKEGKVTGHYLQVRYLDIKATRRVLPGVAKSGGKCLIINNKKKSRFAKISKNLINNNSLPINELAKKLKRTIERKGNLNIRHTVASYAKQIRSVHTKQGVELSEIEQVIDWLAKHIKDTYTPKLFLINDFAKKFNKLEDAMIRYLKDTGQYEANRSKVVKYKEDGYLVKEFHYDDED